MKGTVEVLDQVAGSRGCIPGLRDRAAYRIQGNVVVGLHPTEPLDEVADVEIQQEKHG